MLSYECVCVCMSVYEYISEGQVRVKHQTSEHRHLLPRTSPGPRTFDLGSAPIKVDGISLDHVLGQKCVYAHTCACLFINTTHRGGNSCASVCVACMPLDAS